MAASETTRPNWEVTFFEVHTASPDSTSAVLFANGRMQTPVDLLIRAVDPQNHQRYRLTQAELDTIELVEYNNTTIVLEGAWSYSDQSNEFAHAILSSEAAVASPAFNESWPIQNDNSPDHKRYYVTTTRVEHKRVSARIRQPNGAMVSLHHGGTFDSHVHLTGIPQVAYNTSTISENQEVVVPDGRYTIILFSGARVPIVLERRYNQVNYYISTKSYPLLKANILGLPDAPHQPNIYTHFTDNNWRAETLKMHCIWETTGQTVREISVFRRISAGTQSALWTHLDIVVNQQKDAVCLTRLSLDAEGDAWNPDFSHSCGFELYDIYGNRGWFTAGHSADRDEIVILNGRPSATPIEQNYDHVQSQDGAPDRAES